MSLTIQDIWNRAVALAQSNQLFRTIAAAEVIYRVNYSQQQLFTRLAQENRFFYLASQVLTSSSGLQGRTLDLSELSKPLERLMPNGVLLPGAVPLNIVDFQDQGAELAPRAYPVGLVLNEVGSEWGASGAVAITVWYVYRPADLDVTGNATQAISVPDRFALYLDCELALYFLQKDTGRAAMADPAEIQRLTTMQGQVYNDILQYLDHVMGPQLRRFMLPVPAKGEKQ